MAKREETLSDGTVVVLEGWTLRSAWSMMMKVGHWMDGRTDRLFSTRQKARSVKRKGEVVKRVYVER